MPKLKFRWMVRWLAKENCLLMYILAALILVTLFYIFIFLVYEWRPMVGFFVLWENWGGALINSFFLFSFCIFASWLLMSIPEWKEMVCVKILYWLTPTFIVLAFLLKVGQ